MKTKFPIKEGTLEFMEDYIEIKDKWKSTRITLYLLYMTGVLYPLEMVFHGKNHDQFLLGVVFLSLWFILILLNIFFKKKRTFKGQLPIDQIKLVVLERYNYDKLSAKFIMKNNIIRLVDLDFNRFWKADLKEALAARGIAVESV